MGKSKEEKNKAKGKASSSESSSVSLLRRCCTASRFKCCVLAGILIVVTTIGLLVIVTSSKSYRRQGSSVSSRGAPNATFSSAAVPLVRKFIASNYAQYGRGEVTLRNLKSYIVAESGLGLKYEDLKDDRYSLIIEDEVDAIVGRCEGGKKPVECVHEAAAKNEL
eukprot:TRINITY_DN8507_c2_g1_i1.p1 TRINITY_DN8507_c2_g1~~TRINITY_DN8507_c2_g1_i1.p1  ORF type:complete len:165 (+),score=27.86 TRINITY_DN8507_c2_g1_i1:54-548(+)